MNETLKVVLGSAAVTTLIQQIFIAVDKKNNTNKIYCFLLLDAIKRQGQEYIAAGEISAKDLESFHEYYDLYKAMGGDGFADALKAKVDSLPLIP